MQKEVTLDISGMLKLAKQNEINLKQILNSLKKVLIEVTKNEGEILGFNDPVLVWNFQEDLKYIVKRVRDNNLSSLSYLLENFKKDYN